MVCLHAIKLVSQRQHYTLRNLQTKDGLQIAKSMMTNAICIAPSTKQSINTVNMLKQVLRKQ